MEKKKSKLKIIIFSLIPLLVLLISVEIVLRVVYFQRNNDESFAIQAAINKIKKRGSKIDYLPRYIRMREQLCNQNIQIEPDEEYLRNSENLEKKMYTLKTDSFGFILPQINYSDSDVKLVFLGGSTTECIFVTEEKRFPYLVGTILKSKINKNVIVYNSGVSGNHTYHAIDILINKIIPMHPKYVILMECINDWTTLLFEGTYWNNNPTRSLIIDPNCKIVVNKDEWAHLRGKPLNLNKEYILEEYKKAQLTFINICKANNIEPILMTQANRYLENPDDKIKRNVEEKLLSFGIVYEQAMALNMEMNNVTRGNARNNNLILIDLDAMIPKSKEVMYDIVHYNDKGSVMAADIISKELIKIIK
jgi:hypothetical protein